MAGTERLRYLVTANTKGFSGPIKAIAALATTAFIGAVKVTAEFEKELSKLRAISGANVQEMDALERKARDLGKSTAFTAKEVASLQTELAKLGFTTDEILNSSGGVLDLAAGLGVNLADAAALTGTTLRAFGIDAADTGRVVDVLAKSASSSALDFSKLTESLKFAAPIAKSFNFSIEETVALLGTLANSGISGSRAGTALRAGFLKLNAAGITLNRALEQIRTSSDQAGTAFKLVGKVASTAFVVLANGTDTTAKLTEELNNAEGSAQRMREVMEDNLIGDFAKLKSAVTELGISIGQTSDGPLREFVQWLTELVNGTPQTLGALDSLKRNFLFLEESILLAFKAAEELWVALQVNNPLGDGLASPESIARLVEIKNRLQDINSEILDLSDGFIPAGNATASIPGSTKTPGATPKGGDNTLGTGGSKTGTSTLSGGFEGFKKGGLDSLLDGSAFAEFGADAELGLFKANNALDSFNSKLESIDLETKLNNLQTASATTFTALSNGISAAMNDIIGELDLGEGALASFGEAVIKTLSSVLSQIIAKAIAEAIFGKAISKIMVATKLAGANANALLAASTAAAATGPLFPITFPAFAAANTALVGTTFAGLTAFADGGIVSGPTAALVGEYSGAATNPEVIAPLSKLKEMLDDNNTTMTGGGSRGSSGKPTVRGSNVIIPLDLFRYGLEVENDRYNRAKN